MLGSRPRRLLLGVVAATAGALTAAPSGAGTSATATTERGDQPVTWQLDLGRVDGDDVNVTARGETLRIRDGGQRAAGIREHRAYGAAILEPRTLETAVNRIRARVDAAVPSGASLRIGVRGHGPHGWSEWTETAPGIPAVLPQRVTRVQARLILRANDAGHDPVVSRVRFTGDSVPMAEHRPRSTPHTYSIFATREGLVGGTTANGHVIERRDHFVALPSTRSLSPKRRGDYSVQVCSPDTGRCAFAPVWDVGPWNIHDDYWNPPSVRQRWTDLSQGMPEAEAAYYDGYNDGKDGSGREVLNPAGIDLADGTFWDAVGLRDNAWVDVTYLWTGRYPATGVVRTARTPLRLRAGPSTSTDEVGMAGRFARVPIYCQTRGETVDGYYGESDLWNKVGPDMFLPDAYTRTGSSGLVAPRC